MTFTDVYICFDPVFLPPLNRYGDDMEIMGDQKSVTGNCGLCFNDLSIFIPEEGPLTETSNIKQIRNQGSVREFFLLVSQDRNYLK